MRMLFGGRQGLGLPFGIAPQKSLGSVTPPQWSITAAVQLQHNTQTHCHAGWGPSRWAKAVWIHCEHNCNVMSLYMPTTIQPPAAPLQTPGDLWRPLGTSSTAPLQPPLQPLYLRPAAPPTVPRTALFCPPPPCPLQPPLQALYLRPAAAPTVPPTALFCAPLPVQPPLQPRCIVPTPPAPSLQPPSVPTAPLLCWHPGGAAGPGPCMRPPPPPPPPPGFER